MQLNNYLVIIRQNRTDSLSLLKIDFRIYLAYLLLQTEQQNIKTYYDSLLKICKYAQEAENK
jgi:hypothetical protein